MFQLKHTNKFRETSLWLIASCALVSCKLQYSLGIKVILGESLIVIATAKSNIITVTGP